MIGPGHPASVAEYRTIRMAADMDGFTPRHRMARSV